jgi:hypothetical protein
MFTDITGVGYSEIGNENHHLPNMIRMILGNGVNLSAKMLVLYTLYEYIYYN